MTVLRHTIEIQRPLPDVFQLARQVERYPEFLPGYLESRVIGQDNGRILLQRKAKVRGKSREWQSWVQFTNNHSIEFEHAAGPLKGMRVSWQFTPLSPSKTRLEIVHGIRFARQKVIRRIMAKWFFAPRLNEMAEQVIQAFKMSCEKEEGVSS